MLTGPDDRRLGATALFGLVEDVRRLGLVTASAVVDRFAGLVRGLGTGDGARRATVLAEGARSLGREVAEATRDVVSSSRPSTSGPIETLRLPPAPPGTTVTARAWLHNQSRLEVEGARVRCGDLLGADGAAIARSRIALEPHEDLSVEPGGMLPIDVRVDVAPGQPAGIYQGLLLLSASPAATLLISLEVTAGDVP